jgi:hypothetical protein
LEQGIRSKEQGELSKLEGGGQKSENKPVGDLKNTGFSHPSVESGSPKVGKAESEKPEINGSSGEKVRRAPLASPGWDAIPFNNTRAAEAENKNTGFSHPSVEQVVVGDNTNNGGEEQGKGEAAQEYPQKEEIRYPYGGAGWPNY